MVGRFATVEPLDPDRHAAELFDANSEDREGRLWTYYDFGPFTTLSEYRAWLDTACANPDRLYHAIRDNAQGQAVGVAVYQNCVPAMGTIEVGGLVFGPRLQRRPAATEATVKILFGTARDACVIDQHIEFAEMPGGGGHDGGPILLFSYIKRFKPRRGANAVGHLPAFVLQYVGDHHFGAFARKHTRRGCPHAGCSAGDDGNLASESHGCFPSLKVLSRPVKFGRHGYCKRASRSSFAE